MTASEHPAAPSLAENASVTARAETCAKHPRYSTVPFCPDCRTAEERERCAEPWRMEATLRYLLNNIEFAQMGCKLDLPRMARLIRNTLKEPTA